MPQTYSMEDLEMFCQLAASAAIQVALQSIDDEPELPGDMPDEMWKALRTMFLDDDRDAVQEAMRIAVRQTKSGIRERLLAAQPGGDAHDQ